MKTILILFFFSIPTFAKSILFIGDSHSVGPFGVHLDELLRGEGHQVTSLASCGSIARWWRQGGVASPCGTRGLDHLGRSLPFQKTPRLADLVQSEKPEVVLVQLGGNYQNYDDAFALADITKTIEEIALSGAQCLWVSHPDGRRNRSELSRLSRSLERAVGQKCSLFDSTKVTKYPATGGDGIHYSFREGFPIARAWAEQVSSWIVQEIQ